MNLITLLIYLIIVGVIIGLVYYIVDALPIPDPLGRIIKIVVMVIGCLIVILTLLQLVGIGPGLSLRG